MGRRPRMTFAAAIVAISMGTIVGCTPAPALTESDVVGTWTLQEGGEVVFEHDSVRFEGLYVSPLTGVGNGENFSGSGTWELSGKSAVSFELPEWSGRYSVSTPGLSDGASLKAVIEGGEVQFKIPDPDNRIDYYLIKEP
jgi:hypothetical protein